MYANIEAERGRSHMSREALSRCLGVTSKTYLSYIRKETPIPSDVLLSMRELFQCSTDYLLDLTDKRDM